MRQFVTKKSVFDLARYARYAFTNLAKEMTA